ncbi:MAG: hypothetical protein AAF687_00120 [Pseudomonadota bacterium]
MGREISLAVALALTLTACSGADKDQGGSGKTSANNEIRVAQTEKGNELRSNIALACNCGSAGLKSDELKKLVELAVRESGDSVAISSGPGFATEDFCPEEFGSECALLYADFTAGNGYVCTYDQMDRVLAKYDAEYTASNGNGSASVAAGDREIEAIREEFRNSAEAQNCR